MKQVGQLDITDNKKLILSIGKFRGHERIDLRQYVKVNGEYIPTRRGINFNAVWLDGFVRMVDKLRTVKNIERYEEKIKEKIKEEFKASKEANQIKIFMDCVKNNEDKLKQFNPQLCEKGAIYLLKKKEYSKLIALQDVLPKTKLIKGIMLAAKAKI